LQGVGRIRTQYSVEPCAYSPCLAPRRQCARTKERIATAKHPQLTADHCRAWNVNTTGHAGPRCPRVSYNVVVIQRVEVGVGQVAPTTYVDVPFDNAKPRSSQRRRHVHPAGIPRICNWIVLPYLTKGWIHIPCGITAYQVDLPVEVARTHEGAHIRHRRSRAPRVGSDVVNAGGTNHCAGRRIVATEDEELVHIGRIYA